MTRDLAPAADLGAFLDFNKGAHLRLITDLATVKVDEAEDPDPLPEFDVGRDLLVK